MNQTEERHRIWKAQNESIKDSDLLYKEHIGYLKYSANKYRRYWEDFNDLFHVAVLGFMEGIKNYDFNTNYRLISICDFYVHKELYEFIVNSVKPFKISKSWEDKKIFYKLMNTELPLTKEEVDNISKEIGVTALKVRILEQKVLSEPAILDYEPLASDDNLEENLINLEEKKLTKKLINHLDNLNEMYYIIIKGYFYDGKTYEELGNALNMSTYKVRELKDGALIELKRYLNVQT